MSRFFKRFFKLSAEVFLIAIIARCFPPQKRHVFSALIKHSYAVDTNSFAGDTAIGGMFSFRRTTLSDIIIISDREVENVYFI